MGQNRVQNVCFHNGCGQNDPWPAEMAMIESTWPVYGVTHQADFPEPGKDAPFFKTSRTERYGVLLVQLSKAFGCTLAAFRLEISYLCDSSDIHRTVQGFRLRDINSPACLEPRLRNKPRTAKYTRSGQLREMGAARTAVYPVTQSLSLFLQRLCCYSYVLGG